MTKSLTEEKYQTLRNEYRKILEEDRMESLNREESTSERHDYVLLDDTTCIMVVPHLEKRQWFTYDELDELRVKTPRLPRMLYGYNETEALFNPIKGEPNEST